MISISIYCHIHIVRNFQKLVLSYVRTQGFIQDFILGGKRRVGVLICNAFNFFSKNLKSGVDSRGVDSS